MRIAICDDDATFGEHIADDVLSFFKKQNLTQPEILMYQSGDELLQNENETDLLFLDIEMPGVSGIRVAERLRVVSPHTIVIVITSYSDYLDDAMQARVFRFLSKSYDYPRFCRCLKAALKTISAIAIKVQIPERDGTVHVMYASEIIFIERTKHIITVHTKKGDIITTKSLASWLSILPDYCFLQPHKSYIVNLRYVERYDHETIQLSGGYTAYLTRRKYRSFKDAYTLYQITSEYGE